jgi:hypothetical protein
VVDVTWERIAHSRELTRVNGRMAPDAVTVRSKNLFHSPGQECEIDLIFIATADKSVPESAKPIGCIDIQVRGVFDGTTLAQIDFSEAKRVAYADWLEGPSPELPREVSVTAESRAEFFRKSRELSKSLELAEVALVFLQAPTRGAQNVMEYLGYGSIATANRRVTEARKAGLIPPVGSSKEVYEEFRRAITDYWPKVKDGAVK